MFVTEYFWSAVFIEEWSPWLFFKISEVKLYEIKSWFYNILSRNLLKIDNNVKQKSFTKCNKIDSKYSTRNTFKFELLVLHDFPVMHLFWLLALKSLWTEWAEK